MQPARNILIVGCGAVGQAVVKLMLDSGLTTAAKITLVEFADCREGLSEIIAAGAKLEAIRIDRDNYATVLAQYLRPGDVLISVAWCVETLALVRWCRDNGVLYLNTAVEIWDHWTTYRKFGEGFDPTDNLDFFYAALKQECADLCGDGPTAILDFGANPGMVSLFAKQAVLDFAKSCLSDPAQKPRHAVLRQGLKDDDLPLLAKALGLRTLQISEIDTQHAAIERRPGQFINTWSVEGFLEETTAPAEWAAPPEDNPQNGGAFPVETMRKTCIAPQAGMNVWTRTYSPDAGVFEGMVIRHAEILGISDMLRGEGPEADNSRPAVMFVYRPCNLALESLAEIKTRQQPPACSLVLNEQIESGADAMGVLLLADAGAWWTGSILDIATANLLLPGQNATTMQVAASAVAALEWLLNNPDQGLCFPEALPLSVLAKAIPRLGRFISMPVANAGDLPAPMLSKL